MINNNQKSTRKQAAVPGPLSAENKVTNQISSLARALFDKGLEPIPVTPGEKFWKKQGWQKIVLPITPWPAGHGISIRTGRSCIGIDIDIYHQDVVSELLARIKGNFITRTGQPPKVLIPAVCPAVKKKITSKKFADKHGQINMVEVLSAGEQFVAYAIHPGTGRPYTWSGDLLSHSLPTISLESMYALFSIFQGLAKARGWTDLSAAREQAERSSKRQGSNDQGSSLAAIYNRANPIHEILEHYGWKHYRDNYWTRPGKGTGVSAAVFDGRILWPFSSSTPLEPGRCYDAFEIVACYDFAGDKSALAKDLLEGE